MAGPITVTRYAGDSGKPVWSYSTTHELLNVDNANWTFDSIQFGSNWTGDDLVTVCAAGVTFTNVTFKRGGTGISIGDEGDSLTVTGCTFDENGGGTDSPPTAGTKHAITTGRAGSSGTNCGSNSAGQSTP